MSKDQQPLPLWLLVGTPIILGLTLLGCMVAPVSKGSGTATTAAPTAPATPTMAATEATKPQPKVKGNAEYVLEVEGFYQEWADNRMAAMNKYKIKETWLQFRGRVWYVGNHGSGGAMVLLRKEDPGGPGLHHQVGCVFDAMKDVAQLKTDEKVNICGRFFGDANGTTYHVMLECYLVP